MKKVTVYLAAVLVFAGLTLNLAAGVIALSAAHVPTAALIAGDQPESSLDAPFVLSSLLTGVGDAQPDSDVDSPFVLASLLAGVADEQPGTSLDGQWNGHWG